MAHLVQMGLQGGQGVLRKGPGLAVGSASGLLHRAHPSPTAHAVALLSSTGESTRNAGDSGPAQIRSAQRDGLAGQLAYIRAVPNAGGARAQIACARPLSQAQPRTAGALSSWHRQGLRARCHCRAAAERWPPRALRHPPRLRVAAAGVAAAPQPRTSPSTGSHRCGSTHGHDRVGRIRVVQRRQAATACVLEGQPQTCSG